MENENENNPISYRLLKALGIFLLAFLVLGGFFLFETISNYKSEKEINYKKEQQQVEEKKELPDNNDLTDQSDDQKNDRQREDFKPKNPKTVNFKWFYNNKDYDLNFTLYESLYNYYRELPKEYTCRGACPAGWEEDYYNMFLNTKEEDDTFSKLTSKLTNLGKNYNLNDDQIVELTVSFIQAIPYDTKGSEREKPLARYPYEVLYEKKGLCSGKSFLGALLIKELGYGVALFSFEKENHIVIGIKCPKSYSSYNSGYCYTELTTPGWKIGIEDFDDIENITSTKRTPKIEEPPQIYKISDGKIYEGIYETIEQKEKIKELKEETDQLKVKIDSLKEDLEYYKKIEDYSSYNDLVATYNDLIEEHSKKIDEYNKLIKEFSPRE